MRIITVAVLALLMAGARTVEGQNRFAVELRGGAGFAEDMADTQLGAGGGLELTARVRVLPHLSLYGGWDWYRFATDEQLLDSELDVEDTGYAFGVHFGHPLRGDIGGWVRAGGIYDHIELEDDEGTLVGDTGHELGWEAGAGAIIPIGERFALTPGVRYRTFQGEITSGGEPIDLELTYFAAEIGLSWSFGPAAGVAAIRRGVSPTDPDRGRHWSWVAPAFVRRSLRGGMPSRFRRTGTSGE